MEVEPFVFQTIQKEKSLGILYFGSTMYTCSHKTIFCNISGIVLRRFDCMYFLNFYLVAIKSKNFIEKACLTILTCFKNYFLALKINNLLKVLLKCLIAVGLLIFYCSADEYAV